MRRGGLCTHTHTHTHTTDLGPRHQESRVRPRRRPLRFPRRPSAPVDRERRRQRRPLHALHCPQPPHGGLHCPHTRPSEQMRHADRRGPDDPAPGEVCKKQQRNKQHTTHTPTQPPRGRARRPSHEAASGQAGCSGVQDRQHGCERLPRADPERPPAHAAAEPQPHHAGLHAAAAHHPGEPPGVPAGQPRTRVQQDHDARPQPAHRRHGPHPPPRYPRLLRQPSAVEGRAALRAADRAAVRPDRPGHLEHDRAAEPDRRRGAAHHTPPVEQP